MTQNRKIALDIAIRNYLSEPIDPEKYEEMEIEELEDVAVIWQPFEYMPIGDICSNIESLAYNIETELNKKDERINHE